MNFNLDFLKSFNKKDEDLDVIINESSPFAYVEAYKSLRTNINFASFTREYKKIVVTSSNPGEGKSTTAINLAQTLGISGAKVLLIDCDLRKPSINEYLRIRKQPGKGLTSILRGKESFENCINTTSNIWFDFIDAGAIPPNPAELLGNVRMDKVLKEAESKYDYVICDAPPVGIITDAAVIGQFCDGVLLVVKYKKTTKEQVRQAKENLDAVNSNIIGTVMTGVDFKHSGSYGNKKYGYYKYGYGSSTDHGLKSN